MGRRQGDWVNIYPLLAQEVLGDLCLAGMCLDEQFPSNTIMVSSVSSVSSLSVDTFPGNVSAEGIGACRFYMF